MRVRLIRGLLPVLRSLPCFEKVSWWVLISSPLARDATDSVFSRLGLSVRFYDCREYKTHASQHTVRRSRCLLHAS